VWSLDHAVSVQLHQLIQSGLIVLWSIAAGFLREGMFDSKDLLAIVEDLHRL
jgi:hypothetical protein